MKIAHLTSASAVILAALSFSAATRAGAPAAQAGKVPTDTAAATPGRFGAWGVDLSARDMTVRPGDDFFDYSNGAWLKTAIIPADQLGTGVGVDVSNRVLAQLRQVVEADVARPATASGRQVGALYASFMDEARLEQLDATPLAGDLERVRAVATRADMARVMGESNRGFGSSIFRFGVTSDLKGARNYVPAVGVAGLGLPDRDFYLADQFKPQRDAYAAYLARTLRMIGWPDPDAAASAVMALETRIAGASWTRVERRDPVRNYHPMSVADLKALAPDFDWQSLFAGAGAPAFDRVIVGQDTAVPKVATIVAQTPLDTLKAWEAVRIAISASPVLSHRFVDSQFELVRAISGQAQNLPRWQRGVATVDVSLGEALGREYVARYFPAQSKRMVEDIVGHLQQAMRTRLEQAAWMSPQTRAEALRKLALLQVKIGYPSKWRDYSAVRIDPADLYGNVKRATAFAYQYDLDRLGKPLDRAEWGMTPQTVNAYYSPSQNEVVFPAAILQAPMFDPRADLAVNYGAIGAVIGHEITHGFDDQGRRYDAAGMLRDWWQPADAQRFTDAADRLATQYSVYEGTPGTKINGRLTLGENIGDQGGLRLAFDAYHATLGGRHPPVIDGYTGDQRFFLAFAQAWRNKYRPDIERVVLVSDVHSPARWRVDGTLRNVDEWYAAFGIKPGDRLYLPPDQRAHVW